MPPRSPLKGVRTLAALGCGGWLMLSGCSAPTKFNAYFALGIDIPVLINDFPSGSGGSGGAHGGSGSGGSSGGGTPPAAGGSGGSGGSGGGGAPAPGGGTGLSIVSQDRFTLASVAGTPRAGSVLGADAQTAGFSRVAGVVTTPDGTVFVCDPLAHQIRGIPPSGPTFIAAGAADGVSGFTGDNLPAVAVRLSAPLGLIRDGLSGALIVCDSGNGRLRYFTAGGRIYTLAGGGADPSDDVPNALQAAIDTPCGLAADGQRNVYFTERGTGRLRKLSPTGALSTVHTFAAGAIGPLAVSADGSRIWVGMGDAVQVLTQGGAAPVVVYQAAGSTITGLAFDQASSLYVAQTGGVPLGSSGTRVSGMLVGPDGGVLAGTTPDVIAGTGGAAATDLDFAVPASPVPDGRTSALAGAGDCSLYIDLYAASDPAARAGALYLGNSVPTAPAWAQVLKLERP